MDKLAITVLFFLMLLTACSGDNAQISTQIVEQLEAKPTAPINLAIVGPSSWERVCVLGPYTNNERVEKVLGFKWDAEAKTSIAGNDGVNVLVFIQDKKVIAYTEHPRNKGDFSKMSPRCLDREEATLVRQADGEGWVYLVTKKQGQNQLF